jgi:hypothetical protein
MRRESLQRIRRGRQPRRCPRHRRVAADGLQVQQGRLETHGPSKFPTQIYHGITQCENKTRDEGGPLYLESIDDEQIIILVYDDFISRANPSGKAFSFQRTAFFVQ